MATAAEKKAAAKKAAAKAAKAAAKKVSGPDYVSDLLKIVDGTNTPGGALDEVTGYLNANSADAENPVLKKVYELSIMIETPMQKRYYIHEYLLTV